MASCQDQLLIEFEKFETDLEVEQVLKKIKTDCVLDEGVTCFGEKLKERERQKQIAQAAREAQVEEHWLLSPTDHRVVYWRIRLLLWVLEVPV